MRSVVSLKTVFIFFHPPIVPEVLRPEPLSCAVLGFRSALTKCGIFVVQNQKSDASLME